MLLGFYSFRENIDVIAFTSSYWFMSFYASFWGTKKQYLVALHSHLLSSFSLVLYSQHAKECALGCPTVIATLYADELCTL